jgi:hypothetical protein
MKKKLLSGLMGLVLMGCSSSDEIKYETKTGVVEGGIYDNLFYRVSFHRNSTTLQLSGYGGELSRTPFRIHAYDKDNDGDFDVKDVENIDFNSQELRRIIEMARQRKD